jgi:serine/threonine protein kinase
MNSADLFCAHCGAANAATATTCFSCGSSLLQDDPLLIQTATSTHMATVSSSPAITCQMAPDSLLNGRYRIVKQLGTGGFGAVYEAHDLRRKHVLVAIKSINLHRLSPEQIIEATDTFNREMGILSELEHSHLPHIHDHFTDSEHWYLVMDFIKGETLEEYLNSTEGGYLSVGEVLDIGIQLCEVLDYLHRQQPPIIFRDVKPGNIMRTSSGLLYLIDFGIARRFRPGQKHDTSVLGSPGYAAPEQYGRAQTTVQSDIYSLGVTLRYLLTGKEPEETFASPASSSIRHVPKELQHLLARMLELNASKRPTSMRVVKLDLQRIQDELLHVHSGQPVRPSQQTGPSARTARQILQQPATRAATIRRILASHWALLIGSMPVLLMVSLFLLGPLFPLYGPDNPALLGLSFVLICFITIPALLFYILTRFKKP